MLLSMCGPEHCPKSMAIIMCIYYCTYLHIILYTYFCKTGTSPELNTECSRRNPSTTLGSYTKWKGGCNFIIWTPVLREWISAALPLVIVVDMLRKALLFFPFPDLCVPLCLSLDYDLLWARVSFLVCLECTYHAVGYTPNNNSYISVRAAAAELERLFSRGWTGPNFVVSYAGLDSE